MQIRDRHPRLNVEALEERRLLAATADIVFLVDESSSAAPAVNTGPEEEGRSLQFWLQKAIPALEEKLVMRGYSGNRYGLVGFGKPENPPGIPLSRPILLDIGSDMDPINDEYFGTSEDLLGTFGRFNNEGVWEDGWDALDQSTSIFTPPADETPEYVYRPEAAVHFILISDEIRSENTSVNPEISFTELLTRLQSENIEVPEGGPNVLQDATLTVVAPAEYAVIYSDKWGEDEPIIGIDIHIADTVNVDLNNDQDVNPSLTDDVFALFRLRDTNDDGSEDEAYVEELIGSDVAAYVLEIPSSDFPFDYKLTRELFENHNQEVDPNAEGYIPGISLENMPRLHPANTTMRAPTYQMLGWDARGTVWDFKYINSKFNEQDLTWRDEAAIDLFTQVFVDDTFEKIKLQVADFDRDGKITVEDVDRMLEVRYEGPGNEPLEWYDMNLDGTVDGLDVQVFVDDVLMIYRGDANVDLLLDSNDLVQVLAAGSEFGRPATWSTGDFNDAFDGLFTQEDLDAALATEGYENGLNGTMLPIWDKDKAGTTLINELYFPDWSDPTAPAREAPYDIYEFFQDLWTSVENWWDNVSDGWDWNSDWNWDWGGDDDHNWNWWDN